MTKVNVLVLVISVLYLWLILPVRCVTTTTAKTTTSTSYLSSTERAKSTASVRCKIDVVYVIERSYYSKNYIDDINGFFIGLTEGLKNTTLGIDLKVAYIIYDSNIDYEKTFTSNLTQFMQEVKNIPTSYSTPYAKKALEYAYYEFVKIKNGKRPEAHTYYVLLSAYKSSSYPAAGIGAIIRMFPKNKMFAVGWLPSSSLESDLIAAVGDSSNYFAIDSINSDLLPTKQSLLQKILTCPTSTTTLRVPNCKLDVAFIIDNSYYTDAKYTSTFLAEVLDGIDMSSGKLRVAVVTYTSTASTLFDLNTYNSSHDIRQAIESMSSTSLYSRSLNVGLEHARDNVFTSGNGDRADAWNYYVFTGTGSSNTDSIGRDIRSSGNAYLFALDIGSSYASEWKATIDTCGDESRYIYVSGEENLHTIRSNVTAFVTFCPTLTDSNATAMSPTCKIDIVFLLDDTASVSASEFQSKLNFFSDLIKTINISVEGIQVALVTYGDNGDLVFPFNRYNTSADIQSSIKNIVQGNSAYGRSYRYVDRAIEYASENAFLKENGDRDDAPDYYVLLTHGYEYGNVETFVPVLMSDLNNEVFILVVDYTYTSVYQKAVGSRNLFSWSDFATLTCNKQVFLTNFTECPTTPPLSVNITTPDCKLDIVFILETSSSSRDEKFLHLKYFFAGMASQINVSPTTVRIAAVTFNKDETTVFHLNTYSTSADVAYAIKKIPDEDVISTNNIDNALSYVEANIFTAANGDRTDADNFYVFSIDSSRSGTATQGEQIRQNPSNHIFAIDISSGYSSEWKNTVGDEQKYFYASTYSDLSAIQSDVLAAITTCQITTTTQPTTVTSTTASSTPSSSSSSTTSTTTITSSSTTTPTTATKTSTLLTTSGIPSTFKSKSTSELTSSRTTSSPTAMPETASTFSAITTSETTSIASTTPSTTAKLTAQSTTTPLSSSETTKASTTTNSNSFPTKTTASTLSTTETSVTLTTSETTTPSTSITTSKTSLVNKSTTISARPMSFTSTFQSSTSPKTSATTTFDQTSHVTLTTSSSTAATTTTTQGSTEPPQAKCGSQPVSYPDFSSIVSSIDNEIGKMYLLDEGYFALTCCGRISKWEVEHSSSGYIEFMVWRPLTGGNYKLVGTNSILVNGASTTNFTVLDDERIAVITGDLIGWRCSAKNVVTFKRCTGIQSCPTNFRKATSLSNLTPGTVFNWSAGTTVEAGVAYAVKFTLEENTPIYFPLYYISVKDHIEVGGYVANLDLQGEDFMEDVSYKIFPDPSDANDTWKYFSIDAKGVLRTTRPLLPSYHLNIYRLIISAEDSCDNTASVSLDIATQNWPPFIHSLPNSISINEDTPPNYVIYTTEVTDLYGDPVCCTLSDTHPQTFNFNITNDPPGSSTYKIITTRTARFNYEDFNSYLVYMCCDDSRNRAQGILMVNINQSTESTVGS